MSGNPETPICSGTGEMIDDPMPEKEEGPNRRCLVTGEIKSIDDMVRFAVDFDGKLVPDVDGCLPGRGLWLSASRDVVNTAVVKNLFCKAARRKVSVPPDLADRIESLLLKRCLDTIGLARRAGQAVAGFEKVREVLKAGQGAVVVAAADGAAESRDKIHALASSLPVVAVLRSDEVGTVFGRALTVHAVLKQGRLADRLLRESGRLAGFRNF